MRHHIERNPLKMRKRDLGIGRVNPRRRIDLHDRCQRARLAFDNGLVRIEYLREEPGVHGASGSARQLAVSLSQQGRLGIGRQHEDLRDAFQPLGVEKKRFKGSVSFFVDAAGVPMEMLHPHAGVEWPSIQNQNVSGIALVPADQDVLNRIGPTPHVECQQIILQVRRCLDRRALRRHGNPKSNSPQKKRGERNHGRLARLGRTGELKAERQSDFGERRLQGREDLGRTLSQRGQVTITKLGPENLHWPPMLAFPYHSGPPE
ncbi:MAG: hypothetical protein IT434_05015 [Phycisphaerales bacterium]|nr:hypothetical protein [Phycisphaerales bacterium]